MAPGTRLSATEERIPIPADARLCFLVPPEPLSQSAMQAIIESVERNLEDAPSDRPVVMLMDSPGWTLLTVPPTIDTDDRR